MYQLTEGTAIIRKSDNAWIPAGPKNVDYQNYLAWVADGNAPDPAPGIPIDEIKTSKLAALDASAATAYVGGFYSSASGSEMYYDSDTETQTLLANIYQRAKETDWETKVRYPGIAPAGKAPVRARPLSTDPDTAKTVQLLDASQLKVLIDDLDAAFFAIKGKLWTLQAQVEAAETVDAVNAISW